MDAMKNESEGFLYVAFGETYRSVALKSIGHLYKSYPRANVHVISDVPMIGQFSNHVAAAMPGESALRAAYRVRSQLYRLTPFEVTLWIDADSSVLRNFGPLADLLGDADFAAVKRHDNEDLLNWNNLSKVPPIPIFENVPGPIERRPHYLAGTLIFHRARVWKIFEEWGKVHRRFSRYAMTEEQSLRVTLCGVSARIGELPSLFNWMHDTDISMGDNVLNIPKNAIKMVPYILHGLRISSRLLFADLNAGSENSESPFRDGDVEVGEQRFTVGGIRTSGGNYSIGRPNVVAGGRGGEMMAAATPRTWQRIEW
ncbi:hypothetical protein BH10PLA1_BH10PLA1_13850 [soil metagenome]